ncbi:hypothetical protein BH24GEM3_BH24GEM3_19030 [soil metagenome]
MIVGAQLRHLAAFSLAGALMACGSAAPAPSTVGPAPTAGARVRAAPPPPLPARELDFPDFRETTLPNGLRMIVVEKRDLPVANVNLYVRSGTAADPVEKIGLAGMTAELLTKGTPTRNARQISETIEGVGGDLSASSGLDFTTVTATTLADQLPLAFELVSDVAIRPNFPNEELEIARRRALSALQVAMSQPGEIAQRRFIREIYGAEHPYGLSPLQPTLSAIQRADVVRFHQENFRADNALLVVSGDVDAAQVEALARRHFGDWRGGFGGAGALAEPPARDRAQIYMVHRPGSVQSNILIGHVGIKPDNPDYFPLQVLNKIVGGGTDARLFLILREEKGWTYGAYSRLSRPRDMGFYLASAEVRTEVTDSALTEMMHQLRRIRDERVSTTELEAAKSFLVGSFPLRIETAGQIASQVAQTRLLGLPVEDLLQYRERISAVTVEDVQRVAREYIRPEQAAIIVVGDATRVASQLESIAPVAIFDVDGRPQQGADLEVRASSARFQGSRLQAGSRTYQFVVQGNPMGSYTSTLAREGDAWVATGSMQSAMMSQESEVRFRAADLTPISTRQRQAQGPMQVEIDLQLANGRVTGRAQLPEQMGGERNLDSEVVAGTLLPGMDEYVLAAAELGEGRSITVPVFSVMSGNVTNVTYRVTAAEEVTVPAGTFPAYRVEVSGGPQPMTLYVRREAPHILLRQEFAGAPISLELQSMQ